MRHWLNLLRDAPAGIRRAGSLRVWALYLPGPGPWLMSALRKRWTIFRNPHAHIEFRGPAYLGPGFSLHMPEGGTFICGPGVEFRRGFRAELGPDARITIGHSCHFTHDVVISCNTSVDIGNHVAIGQTAYIVDGNHKYRDLDTLFMQQGYEYRPITIEDHAIVHSKVTIVNNIRHHAIIGANAVITREIPPYCVAAGVPAKVLDYYGPPGGEPEGFEARSASSTSTSG